jgi:hypothetical protein
VFQVSECFYAVFILREKVGEKGAVQIYETLPYVELIRRGTMSVKLTSVGNEKLHEESLKKFLAGKIGKAIGKELVVNLFQTMKEHDGASVDLTAHFYNPKMEYEDGDVEILVTIKLKKIGEED